MQTHPALSKKVDNYVYSPLDPIGKGTCGLVYKGIDTFNKNTEIAVKAIPRFLLEENSEVLKAVTREINILPQIKSAHIVKLLAVKEVDNNVLMFMEYCEGGDLEDYLSKNGPLLEEKALQFLMQIGKAFLDVDELKIRNEKGIRLKFMHRDIKLSNLLLNDGKIKICDFGFAKFVEKTGKKMKLQHSHLGTPVFMSPQILEDEPYSVKCDVWSAGVVLYQCLFGALPWSGKRMWDLVKNIRSEKLRMLGEVSMETEDLLRRMLSVEEEDRLNWKGVNNHPAMRKIKVV